MRITLLLATLLLMASSPGSTQQKVERLEIVDRAIEFHGGDVYSSSERKLRQCSLSGCFTVHSTLDGGLFDHDVVDEKSGRRVRATNETVERWDKDQPVPIPEAEAQRWRDWVNQRVYFPFLPFALNDPGVYKQDYGVVDWDGRPLHQVKVSFHAGSSSGADSEYLYWFDPDTGRLEQFAYAFENGLRFRKSQNFRRVGGLLLADNQNYGINGNGLSVDVVADPSYIETAMRLISTVKLEQIEIEPLRID